MLMNRFLLCVLLFLFLCPVAQGQKRTQKTVQTERSEANKKIERTRRELTKNEQNTKRELLNLQLLEGEISERNTEAAKLTGEVTGLQRQSKKIADSISANETRLEGLRQSYSKAVRALRQQRQSADAASYIFSSSSFAQARSRLRYLRELSKWQSDKAKEIDLAVADLSDRRQRLDSVTGRLSASLDSLGTVQKDLAQRKHQADAVVGSLKRQSRNLQRVIDEQQRLVRMLDDELNRIIEEEARAAAAKKNGVGAKKENDNKVAPVTPLTEPFERCKGRLPWPLDRKATITSTFGRHTHETLERVTMQNNGIDFETSPGASARAVYDGTVSMIIVMEGYQNVVLVRHGEYLTVYAGLSDLRVRKGDRVKAGQLLGSVFADPSDGHRTKLHFEVRHEKEKLDPQEWLKN